MGQHEYKMSGVTVQFPAKAYPSQIAMMSKIVTCLKRSQNSLLESPTGSGKSLALLCAALAWQRAEQEKCDRFNQCLEEARQSGDATLQARLAELAGEDGLEWEEEPQLQNAALALAQAESLMPAGGFVPPVDPDDPDGDFVPAGTPQSRQPARPPSGSTPGPLPTSGPRLPKRKRCPKIFFGTRTHKQVSQIVRELKKTAYSGVRMSILASREHTCIHPTVSKSYNKNQDCQDLMDRRKGGGCRYQANVKQKLASHPTVRACLRHSEAWDLEDLVKVGRKEKACPYYAVRELKQAAQIVFCPYNYLVEPGIRKSMEIFLKNQIVILDEAHNIEDSAREAASGSFKLEDVTVAMQDCERMVERQVLPAVHKELATFLSHLANWMQEASELSPDYTEFKSSTKVWSGTAGLAELTGRVFHPLTYNDVKQRLEAALKEQSEALQQTEEGWEEGSAAVLGKKTSDLLGGIFTLLDFMHRKDARYREDYKISVVRAQERKRKGARAAGWTGKGDTALEQVHVISLNFWCLNPGVCFDELLECKSIILTSGTLSPMMTFASELEVKFPVTLEANHVVDKSQVWVGTLGTGPKGYSLNAAYQNAQTLDFQDEVGELILSICRTVPHGVLVFFPSYKMLNDLSDRWRTTGTWERLEGVKAVLAEPRTGEELERVMKQFYSVVASTNNGHNEFGQDGALFMAVCRGKVSEGLDFADNNARAVVCVGIPFPAVKDTLVDLKKKYNDKKRGVNPAILAGRDWYEIQAFRALNQALGRCIRHRQDWGAILMVDDRYGRNPRYVNSLSKWVRHRVQHFPATAALLQSLRTFATDMKHFQAELGDEAKVFTKPEPDLEPALDENAASIFHIAAAGGGRRGARYQEKEEIKDGHTSAVAEQGMDQGRSAWASGGSKLADRVDSILALRRAQSPLTAGTVSSQHLDNTMQLSSHPLGGSSNLNGLVGEKKTDVRTHSKPKICNQVLKTTNSKQDFVSSDEEEKPLEFCCELPDAEVVENAASKRKRSAEPSPECNFDLFEEDFDTEDLCNNKKFSCKENLDQNLENLDRFRFERRNSKEVTPPVSPILSRKSKTQTSLSVVDVVNQAEECKASLLQHSSVSRLEQQNSEDKKVMHILKRRRTVSADKQDENLDIKINLTVKPSPDKTKTGESVFDVFADGDDSEILALAEISNKPSSRKPLFADVSKADTSVLFSSDDEELINILEQDLNKPSLSGEDDIEEPQELIRRVKPKPFLAKSRLTRKKKRNP